MTNPNPTPSPFSPTLPSFQTSWDSTSLGWFKACPRLYQYQMLEQYMPKSKSIHLIFGGWYASGVERYAHAKASGSSHEDATLTMVKWVMENSGTRDEAGTFTPWESGDPIKNRYTLVRTLIWNVEDRLTSTFSTYIMANGKPAVELSFSFPAFTVGGETIYLSGHMDEVVFDKFHPTDLWVKDDKTTKGQLNDQYFRSWTPNNQMSLYSVAGKIILETPIKGVLVRAAQIGVGFNRFATRQVPRSAAVLAEWMAEAQTWITLAHTYAKANYWPMNDSHCGNYGGCPFRDVCAVSSSHRKAWLKDMMVKHVWNPLEARGDI